MQRLKAALGRSPLTDPRSLTGSLLFHAALLVLASLAALHVAAPSGASTPHALTGELGGPVDNRVPQKAGGNPGDLGGEGIVEAIPSAEGDTERGKAVDPAAAALLSEILPTPKVTDPASRALPGPQTTGMGILPGPGLGGGGGSGIGSGGGIGRGVGPGTEFFGAREHARSFAYVIDCSGSMATRNSLAIAKRELLTSLGQLPPDAEFAVVFYNLNAKVFTDPQGRPGLMTATQTNKIRARVQLDEVDSIGGTDHMLALRAALAVHPEVIFFLTDADLMTNTDVDDILHESGKTRVQAVEFGRGADLGGVNPLRRLASSTGGTYRYLDVTKFPR